MGQISEKMIKSIELLRLSKQTFLRETILASLSKMFGQFLVKILPKNLFADWNDSLTVFGLLKS